MIRKRIRLAQNFFRDPRLVALIVADSSIGKDDVVYEIGPGEGIITKELAARAGTIIAIEKDPVLVAELQKKFHVMKNVHIYAGDFLRYPIKEKCYKIFSNIPFNITADVVKGILFGGNPPQEAYLIVQKEAAEKFSGLPNETEASILAKPWFSIETIREFRRIDFEPVPSVDVVLLHIIKRKESLVAPEETERYRRFIGFGFETWKKDLKTVYKQVFTYEQWKRLSRDLSFPLKATPTELTFEQWLGLFRYFLRGVIDSKKARVLSKYS